MPEGEEKEQEIEDLFEQIIKENFPNLVKDKNFQEVQEAQRAPKKLDPKRNTPRHIIIQLPKMKDTERILKAARGKETVTYKGVHHHQTNITRNVKGPSLRGKRKNKR